MTLIRRVFNKMIRLLSPKKTSPAINAFYTKDYFANKPYSIGEYTYGKPTVLYENSDAHLIIGKYCSIAANVTIFLGGNHRVDWISTYPFNDLPEIYPEARSITGHPATKGDVIIENDVWIGYGVTILSGVRIQTGAVVGAGSVVTRNIGPYEIWAGNPCSFIKKRFNDNQINQLLESKWWDYSDAEVRKIIAKLCNQLENDEKIFL